MGAVRVALPALRQEPSMTDVQPELLNKCPHTFDSGNPCDLDAGHATDHWPNLGRQRPTRQAGLPACSPNCHPEDGTRRCSICNGEQNETFPDGERCRHMQPHLPEKAIGEEAKTITSEDATLK
jgi:hypothetical protein